MVWPARTSFNPKAILSAPRSFSELWFYVGEARPRLIVDEKLADLPTFSSILSIYRIPSALPVLQVRSHSWTSASVSLAVTSDEGFVLVAFAKVALDGRTRGEVSASLMNSTEVLKTMSCGSLATLLHNALLMVSPWPLATVSSGFVGAAGLLTIRALKTVLFVVVR